MSVRNILTAAGGSADDKLYVDDVFSTYTYTGNGSTQTINNGIDLAGKGGLVWLKMRDSANAQMLYDTIRGGNQYLSTNATHAQTDRTPSITSWNQNGFSVAGNDGNISYPGYNYISWTFRKAPKFFDVVTYTGNGASNRQITHALGVAPGMIAVKSTSASFGWRVWHRSLSSLRDFLCLNSTIVTQTDNGFGASPTIDASVFTVDAASNDTNANGVAYVAYLFAHDPSADGIVQCGSFTGNSTVNLGWEPQYILYKNATSAGNNWDIVDVSRGWSVNGFQRLFANSSLAEETQTRTNGIHPNAIGFAAGSWYPADTFIYLAIRRPNKPPTTGTQVYNAIARTGANSGSRLITGVGFPPDLVMNRGRTSLSDPSTIVDRLRGGGSTSTTTPVLRLTTAAEDVIGGLNFSKSMDGVLLFDDGQASWSNDAYTYINHFFRRAPGFMDVVCYTGNYTGSNAPLIPHNLGVKPELLIQKKRSGGMALEWYVLSDTVLGTGVSRYSILNGTSAFQGASGFLAPTSAGFPAFQAADPCVAYLFASLLGISKVGSYTGNGSSQTINCGFTTGARFVLIKRTDSTGDWYVWDSVRGIVSANDPHLSLNTTAAEVPTDDSVDPDASGFIVNQVAATNVNVSGATYLFLAIA